MRFKEWEPIYKEILEDFSFSQEEDERAAQLLSDILRDKEAVRPQEIGELIRGQDVVVCGDAPILDEQLQGFEKGDRVVISADGATTRLFRKGLIPDVVVSDLDGVIGDILYADRLGSMIVVHAHGDNIPQLREVVPQLIHVMGTTQSRPLDNVYNFGGFTDGDRAVYLAKVLGAASIELLGFDYDDPDVTDIKRKKLGWAKKLIDRIL